MLLASCKFLFLALLMRPASCTFVRLASCFLQFFTHLVSCNFLCISLFAPFYASSCTFLFLALFYASCFLHLFHALASCTFLCSLLLASCFLHILYVLLLAATFMLHSSCNFSFASCFLHFYYAC